jgi:multiple sugar transport system permease protein
MARFSTLRRDARLRLGIPRGNRPGITGFLLALPAWLLIVAIAIVPLATTVVLSLTSEHLARPGSTRFVYFDNYIYRVFTPDFLHSLWITLVIAIGGLLVQMPIGIGLALIINRGIRGIRVVRSALLLPMMLTPVAVALMATLILNPDVGILNQALRAVSLPAPIWLGSGLTALAAIIMITSWQNIGFVMLMFVAGLASLPREPEEAASIDGASGWQVFRFITLPLLTPVVLVITLVRLIDAAKMFDLILVLTGGGPGRATENLNLIVYKTAFQGFAIGQGAALAVALIVVLSPLYLLWQRVTKA